MSGWTMKVTLTFDVVGSDDSTLVLLPVSVVDEAVLVSDAESL